MGIFAGLLEGAANQVTKLGGDAIKQQNTIDQYRAESLQRLSVDDELAKRADARKQDDEQVKQSRFNANRSADIQAVFGQPTAPTKGLQPGAPGQFDFVSNDINNSNSSPASSSNLAGPNMGGLFGNPSAGSSLPPQVAAGGPAATPQALANNTQLDSNKAPPASITSSDLPTLPQAGGQPPMPSQPFGGGTASTPPISISNQDAYTKHTQVAALASLRADEGAAKAHELLANESKLAWEEQQKSRDATIKQFDEGITKNTQKADGVPILLPKAALNNPEDYTMINQGTKEKEEQLSTKVAQPLLASVLNEHIRTNPNSVQEASGPLIQNVVQQTQNVAMIMSHNAPLDQRQEAAKDFQTWANSTYKTVISRLQPNTPSYDANLAVVITPELQVTMGQLLKPLPSTSHGSTGSF